MNPSSRGLEPVFNEPGSVQFQYDLVVVNAFHKKPAAAQKPQALRVEPLPAAAPAELPCDRPDSDAERDFLSFDEPEGPTEDAIPNGGADSAPEDAIPSAPILGDFLALDAIPKPAGAAAADAATASERPQLLSKVPWLKSLKGIRSPLMRLHQEIVELCRYLAPSAEESAQREGAISRVSEVVKSIWADAEVKVFGSFATGLYLPTSDLDAVVIGSGCTDIPQGLKALAQSLLRKKLARNVQVISKAKVPIIKFEEGESGYNFDISFDVANGPEAAENVRALMDSLPPMRPLVMVLKVFLQQRELNEVYSGGLGSYALLVMVAAFLQLHPSRHPHSAAGGGHRFGSTSSRGGSRGGSGGGGQDAAPLEANLGVLLVDFFRLFGRSLNNDQVGVSCRRGGCFFPKRSRPTFWQPERPFLLAVEDPNDPDNDLGRNSYNFLRVRNAFDWAYTQLTAPCEPHSSLLARILRLDPVLFLRAPLPPLPDELDGNVAGRVERKREKKGRRRERQREGKGGKERKRKHRERSLSFETQEEQDEQQQEGKEWQGGRGGGRGSAGGKRHKRAHHSGSHHSSHGGGRQWQQGGSSGRGGGGGRGLRVTATAPGSRHIRFD